MSAIVGILSIVFISTAVFILYVIGEEVVNFSFGGKTDKGGPG